MLAHSRHRMIRSHQHKLCVSVYRHLLPPFTFSISSFGAHTHTPIVAIVIVHSSKLSIDWVFDSVDYTANCTYECSALCCAVQATEFYMYGKSFLFITAALINCIATRMGERKLNQTRLNKKRNKITKKHRTWNKNYWKEMQLYETSRRERKRVYVALGNKCIEVARHIRMNSTSISL